jgi:hypothetical protein
MGVHTAAGSGSRLAVDFGRALQRIAVNCDGGVVAGGSGDFNSRRPVADRRARKDAHNNYKKRHPP